MVPGVWSALRIDFKTCPFKAQALHIESALFKFVVRKPTNFFAMHILQLYDIAIQP